MKRFHLCMVLSVLLLTGIISSITICAKSGKKQLDQCKVIISGKYYYTGEGITPTPKVTYKNKKLEINKDYTIDYKNNVNAGTAMVVLVGMGNYTGSTSATFTIKKGKQTIKANNIKTIYGEDPISISATADNKLTFKSSNKKVAKINAAGIITIKNVGSARIIIKAAGNNNVAPAKKTIKVTVKKASSEVTAFGGLVKKGEKWNLHAESSSGGKLTYKSSNAKIASVSKKGIVKALKEGTVTITIKALKTKNYKSSSTKVEIKVISQ